MREIKFRAWDGNRMQVCAKDGCFDFIIEGGEVALFGEFDARERYTPDWPLMQFTGLTDKNGVDIYDCDVVAFDDGERHKVWQSETGEWMLEPWCDNLYEHKSDVVVIGNIHENKELLAQGG